MRWFRGIFLVTMVCVGTCVGSVRAVTAELATGDAPRGERWETLLVHGAIPPGGTLVSVRDARGGLTVSRYVEGNGGGGGEVWMPLPFVAESDLPDGVWPVEIRVGEAGADFEKVSVARPARTQDDRFRVAVAGDASVEGAQGLSALPLASVTVSATEVLSGPPLVFAGVDAVVIPEAVAARLEEERLLALAAAGVRIIVAGERPAALEGLAWEPVGAGKGWMFPGVSLPALPVIEPALASSPVLQVEAAADGRVRGTIALVPVGALMMIVLMRGLFKGHWSLLLACAAVLGGGTAVTVVLLRKSAPEETGLVGWSIRTPMPTERGKRVLTEQETLRSEAVLFARSAHVSAGAGTLLLPIAPDARSYLGRKEASLRLNAEGGTMVVEVQIPARRAWAYLERSAALTYAEQGAGWLVDAGYVETPQGRQLLTAFAASAGADRQAIRDSLLAWYDLRFDAAHGYRLHPSTTNPGEIVVDDLGVGHPILP